ncbi:SprT-like domain-containing protein [Nitrospira sp. BLG_2]|uniref:SprT-like domain-containing protein n=1 Tax=Nitrospira sp. BLG_2 TaxID=3397507 RepID=UPI003B9CE633
MAYDYFREVANFFKNSNLVHEPISVRRVKLRQGLDGQCEKKHNRFIIKVNPKLSENYSIDVLIHEVAHAVAWDKDTDIHGPNWGRAYSKVYRLFLENFIENS